MSDDKTKTSAADRSRVAGDEPYEVSYFAKKHGISIDAAHALIEQHGNDRKTLDSAAERSKR